MTKKEYCLMNEAIACHDYYRMQIHGIEFGVEDYAYISRLYQKSYCGATSVMFHRVKVRYDNNGIPYVNITERKFDGKKHVLSLSLNNFIDPKEWGISVITCNELKAFA